MQRATPEAGADVLSGPDIASRVVRGGALRGIGFGVVNLLGVVSSMVLLRHLGVADFGRYGTVIALVAIASGLADAGLNMTGSRELALLPRGPERRRLLGALLGARLLLLTAATVAAVAFAAVAGYDSTMVVGTALAGVGAALIGAQSTLTLPLVVELRNGLVTLSEILKQVILVVGIVVLVAVGASLAPFFAVQVLVGVGALLAVPFLVARSDLAWPSVSRDDLRRLAIMALPVALASIVTAFYVRILIVLASLLTSDYETGLFVTSARIMEMLGGIALLVVGVILPVATVAARDDRGRLRYVLAQHDEDGAARRRALGADGGRGRPPDRRASRRRGVRTRRLRPAPPGSGRPHDLPGLLVDHVPDRRRASARAGPLHAHRPGRAVRDRGAAHRRSSTPREPRSRRSPRTWCSPRVMLRAVRHVGDGRVGVEASYLAPLRRGAGSRRWGRARGARRDAAAAVAAVAAAAAFTGVAFALRLVPSELTALMPRTLISGVRGAQGESRRRARGPRVSTAAAPTGRRAHAAVRGASTIRRSGSVTFGQTSSAPSARRRSR